MSEQRAALCVCGNGGEWYADNNGGGLAQWYCEECEDDRAERYGCARIIAEGCTHDLREDEYCPCGCNGSGVFANDEEAE
jgi:hypothetical protein